MAVVRVLCLKYLQGGRPSGGHVSIWGESLGVNTRRQTAYLPEVDPFYLDASRRAIAVPRQFLRRLGLE